MTDPAGRHTRRSGELKRMTGATHEDATLPADYPAFIEGLKARVRSARIRAVVSVNRELIFLYWQIGNDILTRQQAEGWGAKVIDRLSRDLLNEFPDMKGFSVRNLKYMRKFAEIYRDAAIVQELLAQITWYHHIALLDKIKKGSSEGLVHPADDPERLEPERTGTPD